MGYLVGDMDWASVRGTGSSVDTSVGAFVGSIVGDWVGDMVGYLEGCDGSPLHIISDSGRFNGVNTTETANEAPLRQAIAEESSRTLSMSSASLVSMD